MDGEKVLDTFKGPELAKVLNLNFDCHVKKISLKFKN